MRCRKYETKQYLKLVDELRQRAAELNQQQAAAPGPPGVGLALWTPAEVERLLWAAERRARPPKKAKAKAKPKASPASGKRAGSSSGDGGTPAAKRAKAKR